MVAFKRVGQKPTLVILWRRMLTLWIKIVCLTIVHYSYPRWRKKRQKIKFWLKLWNCFSQGHGQLILMLNHLNPSVKSFLFRRYLITQRSHCCSNFSSKTSFEACTWNHEGIVRTKQLLRSKYFWAGRDRSIASMTKDCPACAVSRSLSNNTPLQHTFV